MAQPKRVLILGGTVEATELATRASALSGVEVIASLAGRTRQPRVAPGRMGGFGGVAGLSAYLHDHRIDALIDATHPFAAQISANAAAAAAVVGIPHVRLVRPAWSPVAGDRWFEVESLTAAAAQVGHLGQRIFLTIGRQELAAFAHLRTFWFLMRMVDAPLPDALVPPGHILLDRGPFLPEAERSLLQQYAIGAIVSKNSGGEATYAKIIAARELAIPVVMVQRPPVPAGEQVADVEGALRWLSHTILV